MPTRPARVVSFGEIMIRLSPPGFERLFQSPVLGATFGGGEANVAVAVAGYGGQSRYITVVPGIIPITEAFAGELRRFGLQANSGSVGRTQTRTPRRLWWPTSKRPATTTCCAR